MNLEPAALLYTLGLFALGCFLLWAWARQQRKLADVALEQSLQQISPSLCHNCKPVLRAYAAEEASLAAPGLAKVGGAAALALVCVTPWALWLLFHVAASWLVCGLLAGAWLLALSDVLFRRLPEPLPVVFLLLSALLAVTAGEAYWIQAVVVLAVLMLLQFLISLWRQTEVLGEQDYPIVAAIALLLPISVLPYWLIGSGVVALCFVALGHNRLPFVPCLFAGLFACLFV